MQKLRVLTENYEEVKSAPLGHFDLCVLASVDGDYTDAVCERIDHEPTEADKANLIARWIERRKQEVALAITDYDRSASVNSFLLNDVPAWLDKATRVGLVNSLTIEKEAGHETTKLYLNGTAFIIPVDTALSIMSQLELYAIDCYRVTEAHKAAIAALTSIEDVENYDYKANYPERPSFTV